MFVKSNMEIVGVRYNIDITSIIINYCIEKINLIAYK